MHDNDSRSVTITSASELIASIPHMLEFYPTESVVLLGFSPTERDEKSLLRQTVRLDLSEDAPDAFHTAVAPGMQGKDVDSIALVVVSETSDADSAPPHRDVITTLADAIVDAEFAFIHALWVPVISAGAPLRCYLACACGGTLPDPASTVLAAHSVVSGVQTYPSRQVLVDTLSPDEAAVERRNMLIVRHHRDGDPARFQHAGRDLIHAVLDEKRDAASLTDEQFAAIAVALSDHELRDTFVRLAHSPTAQSLWTTLVRGLPAPERAEAAALLALTAMAHANQALANVALGVALESNPQHRLAQLLGRAIALGVPAEEILGMLRDC